MFITLVPSIGVILPRPHCLRHFLRRWLILSNVLRLHGISACRDPPDRLRREIEERVSTRGHDEPNFYSPS